MAKLTLNDILGGYQTAQAYNANNALIEAAFENTLSRDGTTPNQMNTALDMNSNGIGNVTTLNVNDDMTLNGDLTMGGGNISNVGELDADTLVIGGEAITKTTTLVGGLAAADVTYDGSSLETRLNNNFTRLDHDESITGDWQFGNAAGRLYFDTRTGLDTNPITMINWDGTAGHGQHFSISRGVQYDGGVAEWANTLDAACEMGFVTDNTEGVLTLRAHDNDGTAGDPIGTWNATYEIRGTAASAHRFKTGSDKWLEITTGADRAIDLFGGGIRYPAVKALSTNVNTLDHYEEGTFSPTLRGATTDPTQSYLQNTGHYTRVGNVVTLHCYLFMAASGITAGSGALTIEDLPAFTTKQFAGGSVGATASWTTTGEGAPSHGYMAGGTSGIATLLTYNNDAGNIAGATPSDAADVKEFTSIMFSITFLTTD